MLFLLPYHGSVCGHTSLASEIGRRAFEGFRGLSSVRFVYGDPKIFGWAMILWDEKVDSKGIFFLITMLVVLASTVQEGGFRQDWRNCGGRWWWYKEIFLRWQGAEILQEALQGDVDSGKDSEH